MSQGSLCLCFLLIELWRNAHTYLQEIICVFEGETFLAEHLLVEEVLMTEYIKYIYTAEV